MSDDDSLPPTLEEVETLESEIPILKSQLAAIQSSSIVTTGEAATTLIDHVKKKEKEEGFIKGDNKRTASVLYLRWTSVPGGKDGDGGEKGGVDGDTDGTKCSCVIS